MDATMSVVLILFIIAMIYTMNLLSNKLSTLLKGKQKNIQEIDVALEEEIQRRAKILNRIDSFLKHSEFIEPIATWRGEKIYRYIHNDAYLYEFEDIMPETNQRIGMDEDFLCFKQLSYKRVDDTERFYNDYKKEKNNEKTTSDNLIENPQVLSSL